MGAKRNLLAELIVLLSLVAVAAIGGAPPARASTLRGYGTSEDSTTRDRDRQDPDALTRRLSECIKLHELTPEQVEAFMRGDRRLANDCAKLQDAFTEGLPDSYKTKADNTREEIRDSYLNQMLDKWKNQKNPTPDEIQAQAVADAARAKLDAANGASAAANDKFKDVTTANGAAADAAAAAKNQQWKDVAASQDALTASQQSHLAAMNDYAKAQATQKLDAQQAQVDAKLRDTIATQRAAQQKQAEADAAARARMDEQLKADALKRKRDEADAEADRLQAEQDKQLADQELRKQRETERAERETARDQREAERIQQQKQSSKEEEARLQRENEAKAAAAKQEQEEAEIKQREEARAARDKDVENAEAKLKDEEAEFQRKQTEHETAMKKHEDLEAKLREEEQMRMDAEKKAKAAKDQADADAQKANEDVPHEERPKQDNEEDCPAAPVGSPPACEHGGRCFQVKGKPDTQRCSCGKGYKGDKCEHKPCPPPAKEGNMVNGRCVKWEGEYACPGCNKFWELQLTCREVDKQQNVRKQHCRGLREPDNELSNRVCRFCISGSCKPSRKLSSRVGTSDATNETLLEEDPEDAGEADTRDSQDGDPHSRHRRRLTPAPALPYQFVPQSALNTNGIEAYTFVYSTYEHLLVPARPNAPGVVGLTDCECIAECFARAGSDVRPSGAMDKDHCTWLLWIPAHTDHSNVAQPSECRMFSAGIFPQPAYNNQPSVLPNHGDTGTLAFVTFPRAFDMFRDSANPRWDERRTYTVSGPTGNIGFEARFTRAADADEGHGTYVIAEGSPQFGPGCVATYDTRLDASKHYERQVLKSAGTRSLMAAFPTTLPSFAGSIPQGQLRTEPVTSRVQGGTVWNYAFDSLLRVHTMSPVGGSIRAGNLDTGRDNSPGPFQNRFNEIMRRDVYFAAPGPGTAGHLVAATQRPPNFFFNYVPQNELSNSNGCWSLVEKVARQLMEQGCSIAYDVGLKYPTTRAETHWDFCYGQFRPIRMSLDLRVEGGTGDCAAVYTAFGGRPLFSATPTPGNNGVSGHIETTRLMAYTLHREYSSLARDRNDLSGLLELATTSSDVNECDTDVGFFRQFESLTLSPAFAHATLVDEGSKKKCFAPVNFGGTNIFSQKTSGCAEWSMAAAVGSTHEVLKDATGQWCVVMATVPGHPNPNPIATVVPFNPALPCLQFIYRLNPYSDTDAVPHTGWIGANPLPFNAAFVQGANLEPREIQDLTIGYLGTANHQTGAFESCLFWNAASGNSIVFELTTVESACTQLRAMYFFKF